MKENISVINHDGEKIVYINLSGLTESKILEILDKTKETILQEKSRLTILDVTNTTTTKAIKEKSAQVIRETEVVLGKTFGALIGLRLSQQIIANLIKSDQYFTSNIEDAKEWLVKKLKKSK